MRLAALVLLAAPAGAFAQTAGEKAATLKYIASLRDPATSAYKVTADGKPSLRAVNGAVKAIPALGGEVTHKDKLADFVLGCYDPKTGAFAEPGGKPDVAITSVGVMAAAELGIPREKYRGAMDYLKANAKTFEDVRIAAAAVEAWGVKDCPFDLKPFFEIAEKHVVMNGYSPPKEDGARDGGSLAAMWLRLGRGGEIGPRMGTEIASGLRDDGGFGKGKTGGSDLESTYRVMRALHLLKTKPDAEKLRAFVAKCRNADAGYGVKAGEASSMSGTYYAVTVTKWLDGMK